jgi:hypothetical protein
MHRWPDPSHYGGGARARAAEEGPAARALAAFCPPPLASGPDRVHRRGVDLYGQPRHGRPGGGDDFPLDVNGRPSAYTLAQDSAEVKGLTLHTDGALQQVRELQRHIAELAARDAQLRAQARGSRIRRLATLTVVLWLATLIVLLARL